MDFRRLKQVFQYGWKDADVISQEEGVTKGRWGIFFDMMLCYLKYNVWTNQYKKEKLYTLTGETRKDICLKYKEKNSKRDQWVKEFFDNYKFLYKWSSFKYERSASLQAKRRAAYKKQYGLGENCFVGYGVIINKHHYTESAITVKDNVHIAEECVIDYTGNITLEEHVIISEGVKILTHEHEMDLTQRNNLNKGLKQEPLVIHDHVAIGAKAIIMPGVSEIGRCAMISAGSIVRKSVPPYSIVMGIPARIVGFRYTPDQIIELEEETYPEEERLPEELLKENYKKYLISRIKEIQDYLSL
ncbi:MAG: hypothetical protein VZR53_03805 [Prevotella sp.]|nr:hypothetical protein [Prevotella sp.]